MALTTSSSIDESEVFFNPLKDLPTLETDRLILRKLSDDDAEAMFSYCSDAEVCKYTAWPRHESVEDTRRFIAYAKAQYAAGKVAPWGIVLKKGSKTKPIEDGAAADNDNDADGGRVIGTVDFVAWHKPHKTAEVGYCLSRCYWGQGLMPEAVARLITFGFETMGLVRVEARCLTANAPSARVMTKVGMTYEGTMRRSMFLKGVHWDVTVYAIVLEEADST